MPGRRNGEICDRTKQLPAEPKRHWKHVNRTGPYPARRIGWRVHPDVARLSVKLTFTVCIGFESDTRAKVRTALVAGEMAERDVGVLRITAIVIIAVVPKKDRLGEGGELTVKSAAANYVTAKVPAGLVVDDRLQTQ